MRISDWSSDVCSSDLLVGLLAPIGSSVTVFTQGAELDAEQLAMLNRLGAVLRPEPVVDVSRFSDDRAASPRAIGHDQAPDVDEVSLDLGADTVTVAGLFVGKRGSASCGERGV